MTQIQHVTEKEMTRRTGVRNALGYTYPDKDLILLKKGLKGKKKREVLDHEINHLARGEEGPFLGGIGNVLRTAAPIAGAYLGGPMGAAAGSALASGMGGQAAGQAYGRYGGMAANQFSPYGQFGREQLTGLQNYLASPEGQLPTMESVQGTPGYETRLGAIENSAAARGGLLSGNALRDIGEFGASEYDRAINRRNQEIQQRLGMVTGVGMPAAAGTANIYSSMAAPMAQAAQAPYNAMEGFMGDVAGIQGQREARGDWQDFLSQYNR